MATFEVQGADALQLSDGGWTVPQITEISPASGPAGGGCLIRITGTGFKISTPPDYDTAPVPSLFDPAPCYVRVTVGGTVAATVSVFSTNELEVLAPAYAGDVELDHFPPVDIVVQNLDGNLVAIPGQSATAVAAFTYERENLRPPTLTVETPTGRIMRSLLQLLKREVLLESSPRTHTDFSPDGIELAQAGVPSVYLLLPEMIPDAYGWENEAIEELQPDGSYLTWPNPIMHTLRCAIMGHSDSQAEMLTLMSAVRKVFWRNPYLVMDGDVPAGSRVRLPMVLVDEPAPGQGVFNANLHSFSARLEIRRVPILYLPPHARGWPVDRVNLGVQKLNGTLVETIAL